MKKFYSILAAALISISAFASIDVVPSDEILADYYEAGQVCVCIFVPADMACNDIVLAGSFHREGSSWITSPVSDLPKFEAVENFDGWYVASFEPEAEPDESKGMQAKPVMLDVDGNFNWEYQIGAATVIRGGVQAVQGAYAGEIDLINYGADAPNVFTVDAWKKNPCTAVYHNYKVTVISEGCEGYVCPFIVGAHTNWNFVQMQYDMDASEAAGADVYYINFKAAEGSPYQIVSGLWNDDGEIGTQPSWTDDAYIQVLLDGEWVRIPGEDGDNLLTHEEANIVIDLRDEDKRWARCVPKVWHTYNFTVELPLENLPAEVEIVGGWGANTWDEGVLLEENGGPGKFKATVEAYEGAEYKFRSAGSWAWEIETYIEEDDVHSKDAQKFGEEENIVLAWQDGNHQWVANEISEGIEDIVLTVKAQKVVVDGVLYIVRDNKLFNVQGAQVR